MNAPIIGALQAEPAVIPTRFPGHLTSRTKLSSAQDYLDAARSIQPVLKANAAMARQIRRPADESVAAVVEAGLIGILRPKRYGGPGLELSDMIDVADLLAEGCPGTAWDYGVWELHNWIVGMLPEQGQAEVFGSDANLVICCGVFNPAQAHARRVEGGYMLKGRWSYGSGSTHANWACSVAMVPSDVEGAAPEARMFVFPNTDFDVLDTWHVTGLSSTGTHDFCIRDEVFVPEHRTLSGAEVYGGTAPGALLHDEATFRLPVLPGAHLFGAATAAGATRAAITEFRNLTAKRVRVNGTKQYEAAAPLARIARAIIDAEAAIVLLRKTVRDVEAEVRAGRALTLEQRAKVRMVSGYVPDLCRQAVTSLVGASGVTALAEGNELIALLLDVTGMANHASTDYDLGPENYGRVLMGLDPSNPKI